MKNITLGKYIPLDSLIHKLDPRTKICAMLVLLICLFIPTGWYGYGIIGIVTLIVVILSKLGFSFVYKNIKPMFIMMIILTIVNGFVIKTGDVIFSIFSFEYHIDALTQSAYIIVRLLLMITITTMLTATTKPLDMTLGIEELLSPLSVLKFPTHEVAMMISLALRFIPTLLEETERILKAQASRGVDFENGELREKIQAILSLIIPLFVSCFQKADDLADAMEARGYVVGKKRVRYKQLKMTFGDIVAFVLVNLLLVAMIGLAIWLK